MIISSFLKIPSLYRFGKGIQMKNENNKKLYLQYPVYLQVVEKLYVQEFIFTNTHITAVVKLYEMYT